MHDPAPTWKKENSARARKPIANSLTKAHRRDIAESSQKANFKQSNTKLLFLIHLLPQVLHLSHLKGGE